MYRTLFPSDIFANLDRLQREFQRYSGPASSIRGFGRGGFPALNVGTTPESIEIYAFAPGLDPDREQITEPRNLWLQDGSHRRDDDAGRRELIVAREPPQDAQAATHRVRAGREALVRQRLPGRVVGDPLVAKQ